MLKALSVLLRHFTTEPHPKPVKCPYYLLGFACRASQTIPESVVIQLKLHMKPEGSVPENDGLQRADGGGLGEVKESAGSCRAEL